MKENVDASIKLFSDNNPIEDIVRPPFNSIKREYLEKTEQFLSKYPNVDEVDNLESENDKVAFVLAFRDIIKKHAEMQIYEEYSPTDVSFLMSEQEFQDFRSKYLDIAQNFGAKPTKVASDSGATYGNEVETTLEDIDFCLELLHSDVINVAYILALIHDLDPTSDDYSEKRREILDTMIRDAEMRSKADLIDGFIRENVDSCHEEFKRSKADGSMDLESRLVEYVHRAKNRAVEQLAQEEEIDKAALQRFMEEYDYLHREKDEIIQDAVKKRNLG